MGCACNKKRQTTGYGTVNATRQPREAQTVPQQPQSYTLQRPDGSTSTFGSKVEALAERARRGGTLI